MEKLIELHNKKVAEIEKLEDELHEIGKELLTTAKKLDFHEVIKQYPNILNSSTKFDLFLYLKEKRSEKND